ncbi:MAG: 3-deoxy-7-phosphoheptulonate synthase [Candidatus Latescibacteria bacterium]|nr:3-deoxy-7-phosphoheptulonate synthase [Candidatus Latescibacterota bacterium]
MVDKKLYHLVNREDQSEYRGNSRTKVIQVSGVEIGGTRSVVIAGPCAVESREQTLEIARAVKQAGADMLRGGAYKPRTSPYEFQGLREKGLEILAEAKEKTGLPIVTEVMDPRLVGLVGQYADLLQIGSRNMQNFPLLVEVGRYNKPILLKRGLCATLEEWLCSAEYIAKEGNTEIILCERGVRTATSGEYDRYTLDLNVIRPTKVSTFLPIIVDPSHSTGTAAMVPDASRAAISCGAQGLLIEVIGEHTDRKTIKCDETQGIRPSILKKIITSVRV